MNIDHQGVYLPTDRPNVYESTPLANAGWYDEGQHGGSFAALIAGHLDMVPTLSDMQVSRLTVEIFRVIRLVPLRIEHEVVREGKKIQTVTARIFDPDDTLVSMATVQRLRVADRRLPSDATPPERSFGPPDPHKAPVAYDRAVGKPGKLTFHKHAMEIQDAVGAST